MQEELTCRQARRLADVTQKECAERMGISVPTYIKLERNPARMTIEQAKAFCQIVGRDVTQIIFSR